MATCPSRERTPEFPNNRFIINAYQPFSWKDDFAIVNKASSELRRKVAGKFRDVLEDGGHLR